MWPSNEALSGFACARIGAHTFGGHNGQTLAYFNASFNKTTVDTSKKLCPRCIRNILATLNTGSQAIAAETEAIELLLATRRIQAKGAVRPRVAVVTLETPHWC